MQLYFRYGIKIVLYLNDLMIDENDPENWNWELLICTDTAGLSPEEKAIIATRRACWEQDFNDEIHRDRVGRLVQSFNTTP